MLIAIMGTEHSHVAQAQHVLVQLAELEIDIDKITQQLEDEGVHKFDEAFSRLMETLAQERSVALAMNARR